MQQTLTGTLLQSNSWTAHDIYLLLKIFTQCAEDHGVLNHFNKVMELIRANVVFPVSEVTRSRSDAKESVRYLMLKGMQGRLFIYQSHAFSEDAMIARNLALLILAIKEICGSTRTTSKNYHVHLPQQISYCLLMMKTKECGRLLQVKSGEGKTCILSMVAATLALQGKKVDVLRHLLS